MLAFPEYKVPLPGGRAASQNDLFVLARDHQEQLMTIMVEGKVAEPFGLTLEAWHKADSSGKIERIQFILEQLQLPSVISSDIRYQLLHRTVSVVIEAKRFHAKNAVMIVHSFSQKNQWFEDYQKVVALFEVDAQLNKLVFLKRLGEIDLYSGWATGDERFLNM
ncbi:MAG: hypothetical protein K8L97_29630 [Anaerolineae bacterium]|nr:hypothetical protein [Anaerolineae bacterium]